MLPYPSSVDVLRPRELQPYPNPLANTEKYEWLRAELFARGFVWLFVERCREESETSVNIGKIRRLLRRAEQVLGFVEGRRHGRGHHRHHHHYGHGRRRVGDAVLRQILRRTR
jgi:hypothetical protein